MGDLQTDQGEALELQFVAPTEFRRVLGTTASPVAKAEAFAALARINALYMIAGAWSGHIGTSFSSLELMSWIFLNELRDLDKGPDACDIFFSSKGHDAPALYAVLIGLGLLPEEKLHQLRRLGGLPGHPHVETPYIQANTGSLGMGISKAKGMALAGRALGKPRRIFVNSMSDLFYEEFSNEQIAAVFGVMAACPQHTFQVLTKRPISAGDEEVSQNPRARSAKDRKSTRLNSSHT